MGSAKTEDINATLDAIEILGSISENYIAIKKKPGYLTYVFEGIKIAGKVAKIGAEIQEITTEVKDLEAEETATLGMALYSMVILWKDAIVG